MHALCTTVGLWFVCYSRFAWDSIAKKKMPKKNAKNKKKDISFTQYLYPIKRGKEKVA